MVSAKVYNIGQMSYTFFEHYISESDWNNSVDNCTSIFGVCNSLCHGSAYTEHGNLLVTALLLGNMVTTTWIGSAVGINIDETGTMYSR